MNKSINIMKKLLLLLILISGTLTAQDHSARVDKDYKNAWVLRGQTTLDCDVVVVALFDRDGRFISKFTMKNDFGTFNYTADPKKFSGIEKGDWTFKIKCY